MKSKKIKRKGFTLIELLAVIVILAVIALIAVPIIMNMINNARKNAAKSSALGFIDSIEYYSGFSQAQSAGGLGDLGYDVPAPNQEIVCKKEGKNANWVDSSSEATAETNKMCNDFFKAVEKKTKGSTPEDAEVSLDDTGKVRTTSWFKYKAYYCVYRKNTIGKCTKTKSKPAKKASDLTPEDEEDDDGDTSKNEEDEEDEEDDEDYVEVEAGVTYVCKRATTLHESAPCQSSCQSNHQPSGSTFTYGSLGNKGYLASGDAFDCDVNGDGTYDSTTERFYYVATSSADKKYAVLIYYSNTDGATPSNSVKTAYLEQADAPNNEMGNYLGPITAVKKLPTTSDWSNVTLLNTSRNITNEIGVAKTDYDRKTIANPFSYEGYAARLLTTQEVEKACNITVGTQSSNELKNCEYLMENTGYETYSNTFGYWLENPVHSDISHAHSLFGMSTYVNNTDRITDTYNIGTRPAIEVRKKYIDINCTDSSAQCGNTPKTTTVTVKDDGHFRGTIDKDSSHLVSSTGVTQKGLKGIAYLDPTNLARECNSTNFTSISEVRKGCMRFYIYGEDSEKYTMILDHNTSKSVKWLDSAEVYAAGGDSYSEYATLNTYGPLTANNELKADTINWNPKLQTRLIEASEIAHLVGIDSDEKVGWNDDKSYTQILVSTQTVELNKSWYFFDADGTSYSSDDGWQKKTVSGKGMSAYAWLFNGLQNCENSGCDYNSKNTNSYQDDGYWVGTPTNCSPTVECKDIAYRVTSGGAFSTQNIYWHPTGLRPVVEIKKSDLTK